jgi:NAD(P)-dependent dehydrogenase (short-subunit alcohol dehydrogenase family)
VRRSFACAHDRQLNVCLNDRVAVTGGASGIDAATVRRLRQRVRVAALDVDGTGSAISRGDVVDVTSEDARQDREAGRRSATSSSSPAPSPARTVGADPAGGMGARLRCQRPRPT